MPENLNIEQRCVIHYWMRQDVKAAEIHQKLVDVYGPNALGFSTVKCWIALFKTGRESFLDDPRQGAPKDVSTPESIEAVGQLVEADRIYRFKKAKDLWDNPRMSDFVNSARSSRRFHTIACSETLLRNEPKDITYDKGFLGVGFNSATLTFVANWSRIPGRFFRCHIDAAKMDFSSIVFYMKWTNPDQQSHFQICSSTVRSYFPLLSLRKITFISTTSFWSVIRDIRSNNRWYPKTS
uniref:Mos1 transposase HTH domain-containing protein n=1 Tax=Romanomermis culicivorax TaxID=13658 RepID=A0A915HP97_ROMCU